MKDNKQNMADFIGALAEDIEAIKKKLDARDDPDKDDALARLTEKLEPVIRFFKGSTPENISVIFGSKEAIEDCKKSLGDEMIVNLRRYAEADDKNMRKRGVPTIKDLLYKILEMQTDLLKKTKGTPEKAQHEQIHIPRLWQAIRTNTAINATRRLWSKVPDGWYKNPYVWTGLGCTFVFIVLFTVSWVQWHRYREENMLLRTMADKHRVTTVMLNELYPELAVTIGAYEKLVDVVGVDSTLAIFNRQVKIVREQKKSIQTTKIK